MPARSMNVIGVSALGPSGTKADYSNYTTERRSGEIELSAHQAFALVVLRIASAQAARELVVNGRRSIAEPGNHPHPEIELRIEEKNAHRTRGRHNHLVLLRND